MENALPFAGIFAVLAVMSWTVWPQQQLLAVALGIVTLAILAASAVEAAD